MPTPEIADQPADGPQDDGETPDEPEPDPEPPEPENDPDVEQVDLTGDDLSSGGDDLFTGTEDAQDVGADEPDDETVDQDGDDADGEAPDDVLDALDARGESMEQAINEGVARLAVVGLDDDDDRDGLEDEFTEVFEAFRLGYFGSRFAEEYVFVSDDEEVDPAWGLLGAALVCAAFTVWMRPDGDELVGQAKDAVGNIAGGGA